MTSLKNAGKWDHQWPMMRFWSYPGIATAAQPDLEPDSSVGAYGAYKAVSSIHSVIADKF